MRVAGVALLLAVGCEPEPEGGEAPPAFEDNGMLSAERWQIDVDGSGTFTQEFDIDAATTSFLVSASSDSAFPQIRQVIDPDGNVVVDSVLWQQSNQVLSTAFSYQKKTAALNWPARGIDPDLVPGTWTVSWALTSSASVPQAEAGLDVALYRKADPDPSTGQLTVRVVYAAGVDTDPEATAVVVEAMDDVRQWFGAAGIELVETYHSSELDPSYAFSAESSAVAALADELVELGDLMLIVNNDFGPGGPLGKGPSVPGSPERTGYLYAAVGIDAIGDARPFSDNDVQMVAQTIAHEIGHFLGLSHVVEIPSYDVYDALSDTPVCSSGPTCESLMDTNLLYPHINCYSDGSCLVNNALTAGQIGVLHRSVMVR